MSADGERSSLLVRRSRQNTQFLKTGRFTGAHFNVI